MWRFVECQLQRIGRIKERFAKHREILNEFLILTPFCILLGYHLGGIAHLARHYTRVPYFVGLASLFVAQMAAFGTTRWVYYVVFSILAANHLTKSFDDWSVGDGVTRAWMDGPDNLDVVSPAHMSFIVCRFLQSAIERAAERLI